MLDVISKIENTFLNCSNFKQVKINGITNYYQSKYSYNNGKTYFYRIDFVESIGAIIENAMNFQDAIRNVYEDSWIFSSDDEENRIQECILKLLSETEESMSDTNFTDNTIVGIYQNIINVFDEMVFFESQKINNKLYYIHNESYYKINFDYEQGFIIELATSFENAQAHIHKVVGKYPLFLKSELIHEIKHTLLSYSKKMDQEQ